MKETKITEKTTKKGLVDYLKSVEVADKNLAERIAYAIQMFGKDQTKVLKNDLFDLVHIDCEFKGGIAITIIISFRQGFHSLGKKKDLMEDT